jgi:hypothetical protein
MGNYMGVRTGEVDTMAVTDHPVGIDHPTVRPTNFDPEEDRTDEDEDDNPLQ